MTPPELDDDLVRSTIGIGGLEVWIGVLVLLYRVRSSEIALEWEPPALPTLLRLTTVSIALEPLEPTVRPTRKMMITSFVFSFFSRLPACWVLADVKLLNCSTLKKYHFS